MNARPWRRGATDGALPFVLICGVALFALALRGVGVWNRGLWFDELLTANFTAHGPAASLLTVLRFDVHPPLYYLQLSLWALVGRSDLWLMANSILWSAAAVLLLGLTAKREYGPRVGLLAAALAAVSPAALAYADQVRMYAFLSFLLVWVWRAQTLWLRTPTRRAAAAMAVSQLCVIYSHATGLVMLGGPILLAAWSLWTTAPRSRWLNWLAIEAGVMILALPGLGFVFVHHVVHTAMPTASIVLSSWAVLVSGSVLPSSLAAALSLFPLLLLIAATANRTTRAQALALVFAPLILAALFSYVLRPIWLDRIFIPTAPFIALVLARWALAGPAGTLAASALVRRAGLVLVGLLGILWLAGGVASQAVRPKGDGYGAAARTALRETRPDDVVAIRNYMLLWPFMWAAEGDRWGDPLHNYFVVPSQAKADRVISRIAGKRMARNGSPLPFGAGHVVLSDPAGKWPDPPGDLIVLASEWEVVRVPNRTLADLAFFDPVVVERWRRPSP
jgi:mannosyltransferase